MKRDPEQEFIRAFEREHGRKPTPADLRPVTLQDLQQAFASRKRAPRVKQVAPYMFVTRGGNR